MGTESARLEITSGAT